jgi:hypothetical protein
VQTPDEQYAGLMHLFPHDPQLFESYIRLAHVDPQATVPDGQHCPSAHDDAVPHECAHMPQLFESLSRFTHPEPHRVRPVGQGAAHVPAAHV